MSKKIPACPPAVSKWLSQCGKKGGFVGDRAGKSAGGKKGAAIRWKNKVKPATE